MHVYLSATTEQDYVTIDQIMLFHFPPYTITYYVSKSGCNDTTFCMQRDYTTFYKLSIRM